MSTITGRMECKACGSTGAHRPSCPCYIPPADEHRIPAADERYEQCRQTYARIGALSASDQSRFNFELCRRHPRIVGQVLDSLATPATGATP